MGASVALNILSNKASTAATVSGLTATATSLRLSVLTITFMNVRPPDPAATMAWVVIVVLALLAADKGSQVGQRPLNAWRKETVNRRCIKRRN